MFVPSNASQDAPPEERIRRHVDTLLDAQPGLDGPLRRWHAGSYEKTLCKAVDGKLSPATLVLRLRHTADDAERLERLAAVCASLHTAADLADDCEDDDLNPDVWNATDRSQAINVASGLLFTVYQAVDSLPITPAQRDQIRTVVTAAGLAMHVGQAQDLAATNATAPTDYARMCSLKAGAEFAAFLAIAAIILDRDPAAYEQLGSALGSLIQAISDIVDVWLLPFSTDLMAGKQGLPMAIGLAVDPQGVRRVAAGDRKRPDRQIQLRQVLCQPDVLHEWRRLLGGWVADAKQALALLVDEPALQSLADEIIGQAVELTEALEEAAPELRQAALSGTQPLTLPAIEQAWGFLLDPLTPDDTADVQRWGLFGKSLVVGDVFGQAVIGQVLAEAGKPTEAIRRHLLSRRDLDGWRYFPGETEIPCDVDDLGSVIAMLHQGGLTGADLWRHVEPAVTAAYECCRTLGHLPVWLYTKETDTEPGSWGGDDCPGSIANGVTGLTLLDRREWQAVLEVTVARLLDRQAEDGLWYGYYYPEPYQCTSLVVRALQYQLERVAPSLRSRIVTALDRVGQSLEASQRLDGGWGSPQATACALLAWMDLEPVPSGWRYAATYLEESIRQDGGWAAESSFVTIGPNLVPADFLSRKVTTALCAMALFRAGAIARRSGHGRSLPVVRAAGAVA